MNQMLKIQLTSDLRDAIVFDGDSKAAFLEFIQPLLADVKEDDEQGYRHAVGLALLFREMAILNSDLAIDDLIDEVLERTEPDDVGCENFVNLSWIMVNRYRQIFPRVIARPGIALPKV